MAKVYFCLQQQIERAVTVALSLILSCDGAAEWKGKTWVVRIKSRWRSWINGWMPVTLRFRHTPQANPGHPPRQASRTLKYSLPFTSQRIPVCSFEWFRHVRWFSLCPGSLHTSSKWLQKPRNFDLTTNQRLPNNKCMCKIYSTERQTLLGICCNYLWQWHMLKSQFGTVIRSMRI